MSNSFGIFGIALIVLGAACMAAGALYARYRKSRETFQGRAEATVVEIVADEPDAQGRERGIHDYFYPVMAYYADGRLIRQRFREGGNPCRFHLNQHVHVRYKPSDPASFVLEEGRNAERIERTLYYAGLALIAAGGAMFMMFANRIGKTF